MTTERSGVRCGWLKQNEYEDGFSDLHPPLSAAQAKLEADRCYYCYDAPCVAACPTEIDVPSFIARIADGNVEGAAHKILSANVFGGSCARVCPVESLCEGACVRNKDAGRAVSIGLLQRFATDTAFEAAKGFFRRGEPTGKSVAVVGAGPAGLACAHALALKGHEVVVHEAKPKAAGLNEYGIAPYKMTDDFAQREVEFLLGVGGIRIEHGSKLGREVFLSTLRETHDAVFVATGLSASRGLGDGLPSLEGVVDALSFIERLRQAESFDAVPVGRDVVVVGGGSTAIDVAMECKRLGSRKVTLAYRRGEESMSATSVEVGLARADGVEVLTWVRPSRWIADGGAVVGVVLERTALDSDGTPRPTGERLELVADMVFTAIGQSLAPETLGDAATLATFSKAGGGDACFAVGDDLRTAWPGVFAGGDCVNGGGLTVQAVAHGKRAAESIDAYIRKGN